MGQRQFRQSRTEHPTRELLSFLDLGMAEQWYLYSDVALLSTTLNNIMNAY